jgi:hypothetical protein
MRHDPIQTALGVILGALVLAMLVLTVYGGVLVLRDEFGVTDREVYEAIRLSRAHSEVRTVRTARMATCDEIHTALHGLGCDVWEVSDWNGERVEAYGPDWTVYFCPEVR